LVNGVKGALRELSVQLALLNHHVGAHVDLRDVDLDCLDLVGRYGPLSPTALAKRAGLHPATVTGILDRLQRGGWVVRERDPGTSDRRAVLVRALPDRNGELFRLYTGMSALLDDICGDYTDAELARFAEFVGRASAAGQDATAELTEG
jgi:DNA-binding MarR family transcriptional regulator